MERYIFFVSSVNLCSAGIGRTGTIVVIDMILETIDTIGKHFSYKEISFLRYLLSKNKNIQNTVYFPFSHTASMLSYLTSLCRSGLWYWHPQIHPDGARAALRHGADRGPVQVHLPGCVWVHTDHQGQRLRLHGEQKRQKIQEEDEDRHTRS